jgi:UDP-GlcNAc:undecaprenyl-phosphate GlcNAc-1-phosphate transferase
MAIQTVVENIAEVPAEGWLRAAAAFLLCAVLVRALIPLARRFGLVDRPGGRKDHDKPTPVVGGLGIALAMSVMASLSPDVIDFPATIFLASAFLLVLVGLLDDLQDLRWYWRIGAQAAAALAALAVAGWRVWRRRAEGHGPQASLLLRRVSWISLLLVSLHSLGDYPLRTSAHLATFGLLAACVAAPRPRTETTFFGENALHAA